MRGWRSHISAITNAFRRRAAVPFGLLATLLLASAPIFTGCTPWREYFGNGFKVGPNYCKPPAPVAQQWIDEGDKRISTDEPDLSHWWTTFHDSDLDELIHAAYQQNLTLKEAGYRILESRAALAIQIGNLFPQTQQAMGNWSHNAVSSLAANQSFLPQRFFNNWDLGFNMAWELDFWGRFRRAIEAASDQLDASVFNYDDVIVTLLGDVGSTYVEIRTIQQQLLYVRENIAIQKEALDIADARFRGGLTSELDVEQATSTLAQTESLIPQFDKRLREATDRLCTLLGIPPENLMLKLGQKSIPSAAPDVVVGIPCNLLTRRPDVRRAERVAAAQCAEIGIAETDLYPQIAVTGVVEFDSQRFTDLFKDRSLQGMIGPNFQWNVLNYGRLINNVRLQDAKFKELVTDYQNVVLRANSEVEDGLVEFLQSQLQANAMQRSVDAADKAVRLAITQYKAGLVDFNRVALLEQNLVQQQDLLAQAQGDIALGLVRTYRALGGGWEIKCQPRAEMFVEDAVEGALKTQPEQVPQGKTTPQNVLPEPKLAPPSGPGGRPLEGPAGPLAPSQDRGAYWLQPTQGNMALVTYPVVATSAVSPSTGGVVCATDSCSLPASPAPQPATGATIARPIVANSVIRPSEPSREALLHAGLLPEDNGVAVLVR